MITATDQRISLSFFSLISTSYSVIIAEARLFLLPTNRWCWCWRGLSHSGSSHRSSNSVLRLRERAMWLAVRKLNRCCFQRTARSAAGTANACAASACATWTTIGTTPANTATSARWASHCCRFYWNKIIVCGYILSLSLSNQSKIKKIVEISQLNVLNVTVHILFYYAFLFALFSNKVQLYIKQFNFMN